MAEAKKDDKKDDKAAVDPAAAAAKKKKLAVIGGVVGVLGLAFGAALMAVPKKEEPKVELAGPFVGTVTPDKVQVNLSDGKSYLVFKLNLKYDAYAADYLDTRTADAVCKAEMRDALVAIASSKSRADVSDKVNKPVLLEEIRHALEPLLFPVHFGSGAAPTDGDLESGLAPGASMNTATFRGLHEDNTIKVDSLLKKLQLTGGPEVTYTGTESDLQLQNADGETLFVNVTGLKPEFSGEVKVGVKGRTLRILLEELLIQ